MKLQLILIVFVIVVPPPLISAATKTWNAGDGNWSASANWSPTGAPMLGDAVSIAPADALARTILYDVAAPTITSLTVDLIGPGAELTTFRMPNHNLNLTGNLIVGDEGRAAFDQSGGQVNIAANLMIGLKAGSSGSYSITNTASTTAETLLVGGLGSATLNIASGGQASGIGVLGVLPGSIATAAVAGSGSRWNMGGDLSQAAKVGLNGAGILNITSGATVESPNAYIAEFTGSSGTATVDGMGSTWTSHGTLDVGYGGTGTLEITNGGQVDVASSTWVGRNGGQGTINFQGGTLTTDSLLAGANQLIGTGTINVHGLVTDIDLVFDQSHGLQQQVALGGLPNQDIIIHLDAGGSSLLGAGYQSSGSLSIADGLGVASTVGYLAYRSGSTGAATVSGAGSTWDVDSDLHVGLQGNGTLTIADGGTVNSGRGFLGNEVGSTGTVTVDGVGSNWTTDHLNLGGPFGGSGILAVKQGGSVNSTMADVGSFDPESIGVATISGNGSTWTIDGKLRIALEGVGAIHVHDGGIVSSDRGFVGQNLGSLGVASVAGAGSQWTVESDLSIGYSGSGTLLATDGGRVESLTGYFGVTSGSLGVLQITDGGQVSSLGSYLGFGPGATGTATITGTNSYWDAGIVFWVGNEGIGSLAIADGATVFSTDAIVGRQGAGTVHVLGIGSTWYNQSLIVGDSGVGTLNISGNGTVEVQNDLTLGNAVSGVGTLNLAGGVLRMHGGSLTEGAGGGTLNWVGGRLEGAGIVDLGSPLVQQAGTLAPGGSVGTTHIEGGYVLQNGILEIDIEGLGADGENWDLLKVNGSVDLLGDNSLGQGLLDIQLAFSPSIGDRFLVLDNDGAEAIIGTFGGGPAVTALFEGFRFEFSLNYKAGDGNDLEVSVASVERAGDFDLDGDVDGRDFLFWQRNPSIGNLSDWQANFASPSIGTIATVPEPATVVLFLFSFVIASRISLFPLPISAFRLSFFRSTVVIQ